MISTELLSEVLGYTPFKVSVSKEGSIGTETLLIENEDGTVRAYINIYELVNRCKEWASSYKFEIESALGYCGDKLPYARPIAYDGCEYDIIEAETEPEAIIKACQWILDKDCQCTR